MHYSEAGGIVVAQLHKVGLRQEVAIKQRSVADLAGIKLAGQVDAETCANPRRRTIWNAVRGMGGRANSSTPSQLNKPSRRICTGGIEELAVETQVAVGGLVVVAGGPFPQLPAEPLVAGVDAARARP